MYEISKRLLEDIRQGHNLVLVTSLKDKSNQLDTGLDRILLRVKDMYKASDIDSDKGMEELEIASNAKGNRDRILLDEILKVIDYDMVKSILYGGIPKVIENSTNGEQYFIEPFYPKERLVILGGGHIALPLVEFGAKLKFSITVCDDRPSFANSSRFPLADSVLCESFDKVFDTITITPNDYLIVITRGHRHDTECLRQILKRNETIYVGMIGSKRRVSVVKDQLIKEGFDSDRIARICSPIGLSIGAVTPEEISISILAEIIKRKRLEKSEQYMVNRSDLDISVIETMVKSKDDPASLVTVLMTKGSTPRGVGAKMMVYRDGRIEGSIGGGCSEAAVIRDAIDIIGTKKFLRKTIDMTDDVAEEEGMVCGGIMEVLIEDLF